MLTYFGLSSYLFVIFVLRGLYDSLSALDGSLQCVYKVEFCLLVVLFSFALHTRSVTYHAESV